MAQGLFYLGTGLWPILHYGSFAWVTGPKKEPWLVKTTGALITAVGAALLVGSADGRSDASLRTLAIGSALALGLADVIFTAQGRISPVYLGDALVEAGLVALWRREHRRFETLSQRPESSSVQRWPANCSSS
jgi:hypothetical protein